MREWAVPARLGIRSQLLGCPGTRPAVTLASTVTVNVSPGGPPLRAGRPSDIPSGGPSLGYSIRRAVPRIFHQAGRPSDIPSGGPSGHSGFFSINKIYYYYKE
jgi:hypothetical protein